MRDLIILAVAIAGSQKALAEKVGVSHQTVWAWINRGSVSSEYGAAIEAATHGVVSRKKLWPKDWLRIWPELAEKQVA